MGVDSYLPCLGDLSLRVRCLQCLLVTLFSQPCLRLYELGSDQSPGVLYIIISLVHRS